MTAQAADRDPLLRLSADHSDPVAAATLIYMGALVMLDTSGNAVPGAATATLKARGFAKFKADNSSGAAGDIDVETIVAAGEMANSAGGDEITAADIGNACFVVDDQTVAKTSSGGTRPVAGRIEEVTADGRVVVKCGAFTEIDGDLVAANNLSDVVSAATARGNLGIVGKLQFRDLPLDADGLFYQPCPPSGATLTEFRTVVEGATTTTGAPDVALQIDGVAVTDGAVAIAIGTAAGIQDSASPSALNVAADGDNIEVDITANGQDAVATLSCTIEYTY